MRLPHRFATGFRIATQQSLSQYTIRHETLRNWSAAAGRSLNTRSASSIAASQSNTLRSSPEEQTLKAAFDAQKTSTGTVGQTPSAITLDVFEEQVRTLLTPNDLGQWRIGIAVSGGVDSMALAFLCKQLQSQKPGKYSFHAIIVDHQARPGSTQEAEEVKRRLQGMGLEASICTLNKSDVHEPRTSFESRARISRYRAQGRECFRLGLRHLLCAHHSDDVAETILIRICAGRTGGLRGLQGRAQIPECGDIWGVSDGPDIVPSNEKFTHDEALVRKLRTRSAVQLQSCRSELSMAGDGIQLLRPLLDFSKDDLRQTCVQNGVRWIEDETNQDLKLTPRNTVRHLINEKRLPLAMRKQSILRIGERQAASMKEAESIAEAHFNNLDALYFDPRFATVQVCLSPSKMFRSRHEWRNAANNGVYPTHILRLVLRLMRMALPGLVPLETRPIVDELVASLRSCQSQWRFSRRGLVWSRLTSEADEGDNYDRRQIWHIAPEIPERNQSTDTLIWSRSALESAEDVGFVAPRRPSPFGDYQCWQDRLFISISSKDMANVWLRGVKRFYKPEQPPQGKAGNWTNKATTFYSAKDRRMGMFLPALSEEEDGPVIALPTIGLIHPAYRDRLSWKVCHRHQKF